MTFDDLKQLVMLSLREPGRALDTLRALAPDMPSRWMALVLAVSLSTALAGLARMLFPVDTESPVSQLIGQPLMLASVQFTGMVIAAALMTVVGRAFRGHGTFADALLVVAWIELLLVAVQAFQVVLALIFPISAVLMSLVAFGLLIYLTLQFTKALHGFQNSFLVLLGFVGSVFLFAMVLSLLGVSLGYMPEVPAQ
ncbi:YIP1 family protein [Paracoccus sp. DMF-8]|uniref:YIP1 family protein n=1 Tax=Paracoccus sp. DMF-8 TaxID=3019445 RepID=UPI0023E82CD8|nr:YIP1 family protein [Paracoccus sp. DMF-8]MDF3606619.1 YIP1 family protein [Paracoccus sp. DMF-8]